MRTNTYSRSTISHAAILFPLALAACLSLTGTAKTKDPPWIAKDWRQWTWDDCDTTIGEHPWNTTKNDSPWTHMTSATPDNFVELRSALPIRQAILRRLQLEKEYDKMKPDMKQAFDLAHIHDLDPSDQVVVRIVNDCADVPGYGCGDWIPRPTQAALRLPDGTLMQAIQITGKTEVLANVYDYVFPRNVGGKPLYSPSDSFIAVDIGFYLAFDMKTHEVIPREFHESGREYKFKIADMVYKGKLEY